MKRLKEFFKKSKLYILAGVFILAIVLMGQKLMTDTDSTQNSQKSTYATVTRGAITSSIAASGQVETANYLPITTSVNGIVKQVFVKEGETVVKGQNIMEVTLNADGEESLAQAWGSYLSAKNSLERTKTELTAKEIAITQSEDAFEDEKESNSYQTHDERLAYKIAENDLKVVKDNYDRQKDAITQAEVALNKAWRAYQAQSPIIVAPDSGAVANILVVEGMDISNSLSERTSASVASIKKEGTPIVSLNISELDVNNVSVGQKATVELASIEDKVFTGTVVGIDRVGSVSGGVTNYPVIIRFDESSELVLPNMGAEAQIIIENRENVLLVPTPAVVSERQQVYVTVVEDGTERRVEVEIGISDGSNTEIVSGLEEGYQIVIPALPTEGFGEAQEQNQKGGFRTPGMLMR